MDLTGTIQIDRDEQGHVFVRGECLGRVHAEPFSSAYLKHRVRGLDKDLQFQYEALTAADISLGYYGTPYAATMAVVLGFELPGATGEPL